VVRIRHLGGDARRRQDCLLAHIVGFLGGVGIGLIALQFGWFKLTKYDNRSLLQLLRFGYPREVYKKWL